MNKNLIMLFEKLMLDSNFRNEFCQKENLDNLYEYCISKISGYTFEEFIEFLKIIILVQYEASNKFKKFFDENLLNIAGGVNSMSSKNKIVAALLGSTLIASEIGHNISHALNYESMALTNVLESQKVKSNLFNEIQIKFQQMKVNFSEDAELALKSLADTAENFINKMCETVYAKEYSEISNDDKKTEKTSKDTSIKNESKKSEKTSKDESLSNKSKGAQSSQINTDTSKKQKNDDAKKKVEIYNFPTAQNIKYGQNLKDSKLKGGSASVSGHFEWSESVAYSKPSAGKHSYKVVFKPNDSTNYEEKSIFINVYVEKANPKIYSSAYASNINYGQTLSQSSIYNFKAEVNGTLYWKNGNKILSAGSHLETIVFTPNDSSNYNSISMSIWINVNHLPVTVISYPYASSITYGEPLYYSQIFNFIASVPGTVNWVNPNEKLSAGTHNCQIKFTPYDSNYESLIINTSIYVEKATPHLDKKQFNSTYKPEITLKDFSLPYGWSWKNPDLKIDNLGTFEFSAVYKENRNYYENTETVTIIIDKAEPNLSLSDITYNENETLKNIKLPTGWHWIDENEVPTVSKVMYKAKFDAQEAGTEFYHSRNQVFVKLNVKKASCQIEKLPRQANIITYGDSISNINLIGGKSSVAGTFKLQANYLQVGDNKCLIAFTPDNPNYETKYGYINIKVSKNMVPGNAPKVEVKNKTNHKISIKDSDILEFSMDDGNSWCDSSILENLKSNREYTFIARYKETQNRVASLASDPIIVKTRSFMDNLRNKIFHKN